MIILKLIVLSVIFLILHSIKMHGFNKSEFYFKPKQHVVQPTNSYPIHFMIAITIMYWMVAVVFCWAYLKALSYAISQGTLISTAIVFLGYFILYSTISLGRILDDINYHCSSIKTKYESTGLIFSIILVVIMTCITIIILGLSIATSNSVFLVVIQSIGLPLGVILNMIVHKKYLKWIDVIERDKFIVDNFDFTTCLSELNSITIIFAYIYGSAIFMVFLIWLI